jgi:hypothetical protein
MRCRGAGVNSPSPTPFVGEGRGGGLLHLAPSLFPYPVPRSRYSLFPIPYSLSPAVPHTTGGGITRSAISLSKPFSSAMSTA